MKTIDLKQGSPEWHAHRATHFNASDAPAMMGCSKYKTRSQLLHELHTGITPEVDASQQYRFDEGHRSEALARPLGVQIIGEPLYPSVGTEGELSASFDGLTMDESIAFEHKSLNDELRAVVTDEATGSLLPLQYRVQMEQQCMVAGCEKVLFMASKWNGEELVEERHCWYYPDPALRVQITAGWAQFAQDLAAYVPSTAPVIEKVVAEPVEALPAPFVQVTGELALQDNFKAFEERLREFLATKLIREPKTDEDFVNLDAQIKAMKQGREALKAAKAQMLAQVQPVDQANKTAEMLDKLLQENCSMAERLLSSEKERRRGEIVADGVKGLAAHITALNTRLGKPYMPAVPADFGGAIKNKRSLASMEEAVSNELTRAKIAASEIADRIQINLTTLRELASEVVFLFPDTAQLVQKAPDDLTALVKNRIADHRAAEAKKEEEQRERIRNDLAMSEIQGIQQQVMIATLGRAGVRAGGTIECIRETLAETEAWPIDAERFGSLAGMGQQAKDTAVSEIRALLAKAEMRAAAAAPAPAASPSMASAAAAPLSATPSSAPAAAPAPTVIPMPMRAAVAPSTHPTLSLGQIKERIAPLLISAEGLATLGFVGLKERGSVLFHEADFPHICAALVAHVQAIQAKQAA